MIEVRISGISENASEDDGVIFAFDRTATDADLALLDRALRNLGARTAEVHRRPSAASVAQRLGAFKCPNPPTDEEIEVYEREGREAALKPGADRLTRFTDGLGGLGVGSWSDGPASYRQRGFDAAMRP